MKRSDALAHLSRDHHQGLVAARRLNRATSATASAARDAFLEFWDHEGHEHFRIEEDILLPALARHHSPADDAVVRVLVDHVEIRRRAADLAADPTPPSDDLHELGARLYAHIRHEERVLFPLIEAVLPDTTSSNPPRPSSSRIGSGPEGARQPCRRTTELVCGEPPMAAFSPRATVRGETRKRRPEWS
jgi:iron-sulfur cluster repair protein YtfE (RIC family)